MPELLPRINLQNLAGTGVLQDAVTSQWGVATGGHLRSEVNQRGQRNSCFVGWSQVACLNISMEAHLCQNKKNKEEEMSVVSHSESKL